mmetsp:Transcript_17872/g.44558  ORF Transcript_17872/g.44558 Transcript_17872/m.44558 type:complete len:91 (-) Transcript_17872:89-361(-)
MDDKISAIDMAKSNRLYTETNLALVVMTSTMIHVEEQKDVNPEIKVRIPNTVSWAGCKALGVAWVDMVLACSLIGVDTRPPALKEGRLEC